MKQRAPYYGAAGLHWPPTPGRGWFVSLHIWRCGPLRLHWYISRFGVRGAVELPTHRLPLLHHWLHYTLLRIDERGV